MNHKKLNMGPQNFEAMCCWSLCTPS